MTTKIKFGPLLQEHFNMPASLDVEGKNIRECLDELIRLYPEARDWLFDRGSLLKVFVSINNEETILVNTDDINRPLREGDEIRIFSIIAGG